MNKHSKTLAYSIGGGIVFVCVCLITLQVINIITSAPGAPIEGSLSTATSLENIVAETATIESQPQDPVLANTQVARPEDVYMQEYGGNIDVYIRILTATDCVILQQEFDQANENLSLQEPGTKQYKWGVGYMKAADDQIKAIGCY